MKQASNLSLAGFKALSPRTSNLWAGQMDQVPRKVGGAGLPLVLNVVGVGMGRRDSLGVWGWHVHAALFKMDKQQRPIV